MGEPPVPPTYSAGDTLTGGTGLGDVILMTADGGTAHLDDETGFETITVVADGTNDAGIVIDADTVIAANGTLTVNGAALTEVDGEDTAELTFDGSAITTATKKFNVTGGSNNDQITGGAGIDTLNGGTGDDSISGGGGADTIDGGADNDTLSGGLGGDTITGGAGDDIINGGAGNDIINAGLGADKIVLLGSGGLNSEAGVGSEGQGGNLAASGLDMVNLGADTDGDSVIFDLGTSPSGVAQISNFDASQVIDIEGEPTQVVEDKIVIQTGSSSGWSGHIDPEAETFDYNPLLQSDNLTTAATLVILDNTPTGFVAQADAASAADAIQAGAAGSSYVFAWADTSGLVHITYGEVDSGGDVNEVDQFKELATLSGVQLSDLTLENFQFLTIPDLWPKDRARYPESNDVVNTPAFRCRGVRIFGRLLLSPSILSGMYRLGEVIAVNWSYCRYRLRGPLGSARGIRSDRERRKWADTVSPAWRLTLGRAALHGVVVVCVTWKELTGTARGSVKGQCTLLAHLEK